MAAPGLGSTRPPTHSPDRHCGACWAQGTDAPENRRGMALPGRPSPAQPWGLPCASISPCRPRPAPALTHTCPRIHMDIHVHTGPHPQQLQVGTHLPRSAQSPPPPFLLLHGRLADHSEISAAQAQLSPPRNLRAESWWVPQPALPLPRSACGEPRFPLRVWALGSQHSPCPDGPDASE